MKTKSVDISFFLQGFKASFCFKYKLLGSVKAQEIDEMKRHGGLVVDETKLSTHLDMRSSGHIEGFVDLGKFTEDCDKHTKADHGLVVMFQSVIGKHDSSYWYVAYTVKLSQQNKFPDFYFFYGLFSAILCFSWKCQI